jgi:hypothetical protein
MDIDEKAPIKARGSLQIDATADEVWEIMTGFADWPSWNPQIVNVEIDGPPAPGTTFRWRSGPGTITSVLRAVESPRELGWTGKTMGIKAAHVWRIEPSGSGVRVMTMESWRGWPTYFMRKRMTRTLEDAIEQGLQNLKLEAERRAGDTVAGAA